MGGGAGCVWGWWGGVWGGGTEGGEGREVEEVRGEGGRDVTPSAARCHDARLGLGAAAVPVVVAAERRQWLHCCVRHPWRPAVPCCAVPSAPGSSTPGEPLQWPSATAN